jgi:hypothetical protein
MHALGWEPKNSPKIATVPALHHPKLRARQRWIAVTTAAGLSPDRPVSDRTDDALGLAGRTHQSIDPAVDRFGATRPALVAPPRTTRCESSPLLAHHPTDPSQLSLKRLVSDDDIAKTVGSFARQASPVVRHPGREIAALQPARTSSRTLASTVSAFATVETDIPIPSKELRSTAQNLRLISVDGLRAEIQFIGGGHATRAQPCGEHRRSDGPRVPTS